MAHFSEHLLSARYGARCGARGFYVVCHLLLTPPMGLSVFLTCFTDEKTEAQGGEGTRQGRKAHGGRIQTQVCFRGSQVFVPCPGKGWWS